MLSTDRAVWAYFGDRPGVVHELARRIREGSSVDAVAAEVEQVVDDDEFVEGRVLTALRRIRERDPGLRRKVLANRKACGKLACDGCGDGPKAV